jgi:hypothetical protein
MSDTPQATPDEAGATSAETPDADTLVTPDMVARRGVWGGERLSPPIAESDIRKWAIATYWPERPPRIYWDADYAKTTRYEGIIAPSDFNPFAWPVERPRPPGMAALARRRSGPRITTMNGGQTDTYGAPMRAGDIIRSRTRLRDWEERHGRLGLTLYTYTETEWTNQASELVRRRVSTSIRYRA